MTTSRTGRFVALLAGLGALATARPAEAQLAAVTKVGPRPAFILMIDSSESMDYTALTESAQACVAGGACEQSRLDVIVRAMTGSPADDACVFEEVLVDGPPPQGNPLVCAANVPGYDDGTDDTGIMDSYIDTVRFGMMVSDNIDGPTVKAEDGHSDGETKQAPDGSSIRLGMRGVGSKTGTRTGIGPPSLNGDLSARNEALQSKLASIVPFGESSLDAMIVDAKYYKENEPTVQPGPGAASANACRATRYVLLTDGVRHPLYDGAVDSNPYDDELSDAVEGIVDPFTDLTIVPLSANAADSLQLFQDAGIEVTDPASSVDDLRNVLDTLISEHLNAGEDVIESQSKSTSTVQTFNLPLEGGNIGQMQVGAAYSVESGEDDDDESVVRRGHLERLDFKCGDTDPARSVDLANDSELGLPNQGSRTIWTSVEGDVVPFATDDVTATALQVPPAKRDSLIDWFYWQGSDDYPFDEESDPRLGPVVHSSPAVLSRPDLDLNFAAYQSGVGDEAPYKVVHAARPTVALFGANDAMFHAFILAQESTDTRPADQRPELFAYMPSFFLHKAQLVAQGQTGQSFVDAPPLVRTVRLEKSALITPDEEISDELWRDVVVGGTGPGGPYWYALDVTDVERGQDGDSKPALLWEFPGEDHPNVDSDLLADLTGVDGELVESTTYLGESWTRPAIGSVTLAENTLRVERAVAFIPGGRDGGDPQRGRSLYVVQLAKDAAGQGLPKVLRSFRTGLGNQEDDIVFPITGEPVAFLDGPGRQTSRVFVGDEGGRLWRIEVGADSVTDWKMQMVHDAYEGLALDSVLRRPVTFAPSVAEDQARKLVVVYGTGDATNLGAFTLNQKVWSVTEQLKPDPNDEGRIFDKMSENWRIDLETGEQLTGPPLIFDEVAYFPSFSKKGLNVCKRGEGRIWAVDFVGLADDEDLAGSVVPRFATNKVQTSTGFVMDDPPLCSDDEEIVNPNDADRASLYCSMGSAISFGLEITYRPLCEDDFNDPSQYGDGGGARQPVLAAQATGTAVGKPAGTSKQKSKGKSMMPQLRKRLPTPQNQPMPLSWGVVFE